MERIINKPEFTADLTKTFGEISEVDKICAAEYSNGYNLRELCEDGRYKIESIQRIAIMHVDNMKVGDEYDVVVLLTDDGSYYCTTPQVADSINSYIERAEDINAYEMSLMFSLAESKSRKGAKYLRVALVGMR